MQRLKNVSETSIDYSPEQRLAVGVLVLSLRDGFLVRSRKAKRHERSARYWFFDEPLDADAPFSFANTMDMLGQDPMRVRGYLARMWRDEPDKLRKLIEECAYQNPWREGKGRPLFQPDAHGQLLLFGELLAA